MRIIAGAWRGRAIVAPPGDSTRPTTDRVREALFSMLASRLGSFEGLRVADLFAGSGALGLEALSRGAAHCTFVEQDLAALKALRHNVRAMAANADIQSRSALDLGQGQMPHDLVFMDPPYGQDLVKPVLERLQEKCWVAPGAWISVETERDVELGCQGFAMESRRGIGKAQIALLRPAL